MRLASAERQKEREKQTERAGGWGVMRESGRERSVQTRCVSGSMCATCDSQP